MPITIRKIELFCSLLFFSPTSLQRAKNACFSLIFPEKSAFRNGFELRRSDVKKDFFFNIFRRRSVESSSDNFRFFPTNTVSFDIYQKTRNQLNSKEFRGFESHRLRQVSLLNFTLGSDFFIAALQNPRAFLIDISPLFSSSDFRVRYKSYQQSRQIAIHRTTQDSSRSLGTN